MQSSSAKAATGHLKHTEGIFLHKAHRFKTGDDLDNLCARLETHFKKHGMDTITRQNNPNHMSEMVSALTSHPLFTVKSVENLNKGLIHRHSTHNKQNDNNAIECFMNSLGKDL